MFCYHSAKFEKILENFRSSLNMTNFAKYFVKKNGKKHTHIHTYKPPNLDPLNEFCKFWISKSD